MDVTLSGQTDLAGFRAEARQLLARQVAPEEVRWQLDLDDARVREPQSPLASRPRNVARAATAIVPASFTRLCELVVLHREPGRFALLYRLLWRLVHEPGLRNDPADADMQQAQHMAHAVRRDIHKMKANLRLHTLRDARGAPLQVGCHEPAHHIVEAVGPWLGRRLGSERWALFTPERSVRGGDGQLAFGAGVPSAQWPGPGASEADWCALCERVFAHALPVAHA